MEFDIKDKDFRSFTILNINNRLGHDVRDKVLPVSSSDPPCPACIVDTVQKHIEKACFTLNFGSEK
jgi:hypothetical protein